MKATNDAFLNAIKATARQVEIKLEFVGLNPSLILTSDDIKDLNYRSEAPKELGGAEIQLLSIKVMRDVIPSEVLHTNAELIFSIGAGSPIEWCKVGQYKCTSWKNNDKNGIVSIECEDQLQSLLEHSIPFIPTMMNITKSDYLKKIADAIKQPIKPLQGLHDGKLIMAMLGGTKIGDTLVPLSMAMNGLIRSREGIEIIPFKAKSTAQSSLLYKDMIINIENGKDNFKECDIVNICIYLPSTNEFKEIAKLNDLNVPASYNNFRVGTITFDGNKIAKCISFDKEVLIRDFNISTQKLSVDIDNPSEASINLNVKVEGSDLQDTSVESISDSENRIKTIKNTYIQDVSTIGLFDTRIYLYPEIKLKYRGNPCIEVGDTISVEEIGNILVTYNELSFNGALSGILRGVRIDGK